MFCGWEGARHIDGRAPRDEAVGRARREHVDEHEDLVTHVDPDAANRLPLVGAGEKRHAPQQHALETLREVSAQHDAAERQPVQTRYFFIKIPPESDAPRQRNVPRGQHAREEQREHTPDRCAADGDDVRCHPVGR